MENSVETDVRTLHVVGTAGVAAHLGLPVGASQDSRVRLVLAAPRAYRIRGELVRLPQVIGVARRPLLTTTAMAEQADAAA